MRETGVREKVEKGEEEREEDELKAQRERDNETMRERERKTTDPPSHTLPFLSLDL